MRRAALSLPLLAACAAAPVPPVPAPPGPHAPAVRRPSPADRYGAEPAFRASALEAEALAAVRERLGGAPQQAPSLSLAARELAAGVAAGERDALGHRRIRAALAGALAADPAPTALTVSAAPRRLAPLLAASLQQLDATHVGVGVAERRGTAHAVLLASRRQVRLEPFPREVAAGAAVELRGALVGLGAPRVVATGPDGKAREVAVDGSSTFRAKLRFDRAGRWVVEVVGAGPRGPQVAALLVVSAGGAAIAQPVRPPAGPEPEGDAAAEARVLGAVNALRGRHGLPGLEASDPLRELARRHSAAMLSSGTLAHVLPGSGSAAERLRQARVPFRRVLENVAKGASAFEAQEALEDSPAHLGNLLDPAVGRAGVGLARGRLASGEPIVYLTQILVQPVDDTAESRIRPAERVREALWRERRRLGRPPLRADPALDAVAEHAARAMLRAGEPAAEADTADRVLALGRTVAAADAFLAASPGDAARSENLADARWHRVGVGVAVGDSPRYGAGLLWIAVVYSD